VIVPASVPVVSPDVVPNQLGRIVVIGYGIEMMEL